MRNYATLKVKDELARLPGVGQIQIFGSGEYAMRVWLDPNKVAARGLTASDVVTAMQEQTSVCLPDSLAPSRCRRRAISDLH